MVQKEVKKKTTTYALVAILSAVMLVTLVYTFGAAPLLYPPSQMPQVAGMKTFSSVEDIVNFLNANTQGYYSYSGGPLDSKFFGSRSFATPMPEPSLSGIDAFPLPAHITSSQDTSESNGAGSYSMYSTTNIQVAGVDEADTVKTDGQYIYTLSSTQNGGYYYYGGYSQENNAVYILNADPQNPQVVSKIILDNSSEPAGLFLSSDGSRLVVLASKYQYYSGGDEPVYPLTRTGGVEIAPTPMLTGYGADVYTYINVYDVSNKASPVLTRNFTASGSYFNSRMIGDNVYAVVSQPAQVYQNTVLLPAVFDGKTESDASPSSIYYADMNQSSYCTFTSYYGLNIKNDAEAPTNMTVMMGGASTMYVSSNNIYVTYPNWENGGQYTDIYRVSIDGLQLNMEAQGAVPGTTINQYSMDEYNGYFRIATNWHDYSQGESQQTNNVYVLNSDMTIVGRLEGLGQNENLHATRFMGDKLYLVTFKKTDPLFVIDLSVPSNPKVLGELKIPGYSDYLHPYDESHLIGVGKEAVEANDPNRDFAWYQGVKISLFDVSDVNNPTQLGNYVIGDRGTDSAVLSDPKAFLFDKSTGLLVIPVNLAWVDNSTGNTDVSSYGQMVWQGAYVFTVSLDGGFTLKGTVTHIDPSLLNSQGHVTDSQAYYSSQNDFVTRALYIGNTLYTVSNDKVKLNSLTDMSQIAEVNLA